MLGHKAAQLVQQVVQIALRQLVQSILKCVISCLG